MGDILHNFESRFIPFNDDQFISTHHDGQKSQIRIQNCWSWPIYFYWKLLNASVHLLLSNYGGVILGVEDDLGIIGPVLHSQYLFTICSIVDLSRRTPFHVDWKFVPMAHIADHYLGMVVVDAPCITSSPLKGDRNL